MSYSTQLEMLRVKNMKCADTVDSAQGGHVEIVKTPSGLFVPAVESSGRKMFLHSRFDPVKEAERFCAEITDFTFDVFVVFGFAFAYHVELIARHCKKDCTILVIEKDPLIARRAIESRDLSALLSDNRFFLLISPDEDDLAHVLRGKSSQKVTFITHRGSASVYGEYYQNLMNIVKAYFSTKDVNIATLAKFEKLWASNSARNIESIIELPAAKSFYGRFHGLDAIVVCAGPSLGKSLDFIRANRARAVIIAVDTAYSILMKNGIVAHFTICVDPQIINARYFEHDYPGKTILIMDPTAHPSVFRFFSGRKCVSGTTFENMRWLEEITGDKGEITHGGSVSTNAYDFAKRLGVERVILVGQDLAFTESLAHARGAYLDEHMHIRTTRFFTQNDFNRRQLYALPKVMVKSIKGSAVHTNQKMLIFLNWFEKRNDPHLINATHDGAYISGVRHEIPQTLSGADIDSIVDAAYGESVEQLNLRRAEIRSRVKSKVDVIFNELESFSERVGKACLLASDLCDAVGKNDDAKVRYCVSRLDAIDEYLESRKRVTDIIGISMQRAIHTITEGFDVAEDDSDSENLKVAKKSLYLYTEMRKNLDFNIRLASKMKKAVSFL